jgi:hypothetical protein
MQMPRSGAIEIKIENRWSSVSVARWRVRFSSVWNSMMFRLSLYSELFVAIRKIAGDSGKLIWRFGVGWRR